MKITKYTKDSEIFYSHVDMIPSGVKAEPVMCEGCHKSDDVEDVEGEIFLCEDCRHEYCSICHLAYVGNNGVCRDCEVDHDYYDSKQEY